MENSPSTTRPVLSKTQALKTLLRADFKVQWRQRRAIVMSLLVPIIFVVSWKGLIAEVGAHNVLAICIAIGLPAIGLMGYSQSVARDRDRGVFQRLRAAPINTGSVMMSRIIVQLSVIAFMTLVTYLVGWKVDEITIGFVNVIALIIAALISGLAFLGLGQMVVGLIRSSEAVNAAARLIYFPLAVLGAIGQIGVFGKTVELIVTYSPLGTTKMLLAGAMDFHTITMTTLWALLLTLGYGIIFATIGIKKFKWTS